MNIITKSPSNVKTPEKIFPPKKLSSPEKALLIKNRVAVAQQKHRDFMSRRALAKNTNSIFNGVLSKSSERKEDYDKHAREILSDPSISSQQRAELWRPRIPGVRAPRGWWREILPTKGTFNIPPGGEREDRIRKAQELCHTNGTWTLRVWWGRIPQGTLWEYATSATKHWAGHPNLIYFAKCLATAAHLWKDFPDPAVWHELSQWLHRWGFSSRRFLIFLLNKVKAICGKRFREEFLKEFTSVPASVPASFKSTIAGIFGCLDPPLNQSF